MVYRHFRLRCILRIAFLAATLILLAYILFESTYYATVLIVGVAVLYQIFALIHFVERTNRDLTRFLDTIRYQDFSQSFTGTGLGSAFDDLKKAFNEVLDAFRRTRADREEQHRYLHTVVQHVGVGLICFRPDGKIELVNTAAQRLLGIPQFHNIRQLEGFSQPLVDAMLRLRSGEKALVKAGEPGEALQLVLYATELRMREQQFTLVSIQNIQSELEAKEMEAWQNLIRVLTHEIMNSVTPISSLASTVNVMLSPKGAENVDAAEAGLSEEAVGDVREAVSTIERRSQGLLHFVEQYRRLTRVPNPAFEIFPVNDLLERTRQLLRAELEDREITLNLSVDPDSLELTADPGQVEQVLINLITNAMHAVEDRDHPCIDVHSRLDGRGRVLMEVTDNGPGILPETQERIFIPFFTTKKEGSGIGLSLARQIMRLHRGTISVHSEPEHGATFTLRF